MPIPALDPIRTERLEIRPVRADDLPALLDVKGDAEVTRFLPCAAWNGRADAEAWLGRMKAMADAGTSRQLR